MHRRAILRILAVGTIAVCASACGAAPGADDRSFVDVRDSSGVRLVHNLDARADTQAIRFVEDLRLGVVDGEAAYQFHLITGIATDELGRIYAIDQGAQSVRMFDQTGRFIRQFGGPGDGPGEFRRIGSLFLMGDTIHVADNSTRAGRGVLFDTTGALLGTYASRLDNGSVLRPVNAGRTGWFVHDDSALASQRRDRAGDVTRYRVAIARLDPRHLESVMASREVADSLLVPVVAYEYGRIFWELGSEGGSERFPLGNPPLFEPSPSSVVDVRGFVHVARGWPYAIDTYDDRGRLVRRVTRAHDSIPVTDALIDETLGRVRAYYDTAGQRDFSATYVKRAAYPRIGYVPVTSTVLASTNGWLWVRRPDLEPDPSALVFSAGRTRPSIWDVFDPDGAFRFTARLPDSFSPRVVTSDTVLGVDSDELGVQYIVRLAIEEREPE